jgi:hypothetical protein
MNSMDGTKNIETEKEFMFIKIKHNPKKNKLTNESSDKQADK